MTLCDTSFLVALLSNDSSKRKHYSDIFNKADKPLLITWPCIAEAMHLIGQHSGWTRQKICLQLLKGSAFETFEIQPKDYARLIDLMEKYSDRPMDLADASLVLIAEHTKQNKILTSDSDFFFYRINGRESFEVIPI